MNLTLFFRLIMMSIFQKQVVYDKQRQNPYKEGMSYDNKLFYCPKVFAKDGFSVSLQIHNGSYCSSNNGYRKLGDTMEEVEFGFPSENEDLMKEYAEDSDNLTETVGRIPVSIMEIVFEKHGGIDWEKTISIDQFNTSVYGKQSISIS